MVKLSVDEIRRKAEHHDGVLADLEEISLHQMEIEKLEVIGKVCRRLRILYLQNNIISKMENLYHMKDLRYINLALNNVTKIEGIKSCEFLNKLDMTANFINFESLRESVDNLAEMEHLKELFVLGNPFMNPKKDLEKGDETIAWDYGRQYLIARLPQLNVIDGKEITLTERIMSEHLLEDLEKQLDILAEARQRELDAKARVEEEFDEDAWTPEARTHMYREMAEHKEEKETQRKQNQYEPRDFEQEHEEAVKRARERKRNGRIRQCNEGNFKFSVEDDDGNNNCVLRLSLPRFLNSALIDTDVHPDHVVVVAKNKRFCILWPEEVHSEKTKAERSTTTGELKLIAPKVSEKRKFSSKMGQSTTTLIPEIKSKASNKKKTVSKRPIPSLSLAEQMLADAAVDYRNIVPQVEDIEKEKTDSKPLIELMEKDSPINKSFNEFEVDHYDENDVPPLE
eukprot:TRINITY_DN6670_c0_g1_i1.p1 TRINITY_DN6670_c0_g1~~TRINITY_DN6670_c0_g1_i1.p1  ORF type:complete len:455 (+),score=118.62 TRINITY_DN6670_c0_g1_i1:79-1443(+)